MRERKQSAEVAGAALVCPSSVHRPEPQRVARCLPPRSTIPAGHDANVAGESDVYLNIWKLLSFVVTVRDALAIAAYPTARNQNGASKTGPLGDHRGAAWQLAPDTPLNQLERSSTGMTAAVVGRLRTYGGTTTISRARSAEPASSAAVAQGRL